MIAPARPSRPLVLTLLVALSLAVAGVGATALAQNRGLADATAVESSIRGLADATGTATVQVEAALDAEELAELAELGGKPAPSDRDVAALQALADRGALVLQAAADRSRRAVLTWDGEPAIELVVDDGDLPDLAAGLPTDPFDVTVAARLNAFVVLDAATTLGGDIGPADLMDLPGDFAVDEGEGADPLAHEALVALLRGEWVAVSGTIEPGADAPQDQLTDPALTPKAVEDALAGVVSFSDPSRALDGLQTATASLDVGRLLRGVQELAVIARRDGDLVSADLGGIDLVLTDLVQLVFTDGVPAAARVDVLDALGQILAGAAVSNHEHADRAAAAAAVLNGWTRTSVEVVTTFSDPGLATVLDGVNPTVTMTVAQLRGMIPSGDSLASGR